MQQVRQETILREILRLGFASQERAVSHGAGFAILTAALMWDAFDHALMLGWLATYLALLVLRVRIAKVFLGRDVPDAELQRWVAVSAGSTAATGLLWGVLGAVAIGIAPTAPLYAMWIIFVVGIFAILQTNALGAHPAGFWAFTLCSMTPILVMSIFLDAPHYWVRLLAEVLFVVMAIRAGLAGTRYVTDSVRVRFENVELLRDVTRQKEELARQKDELDRANAAKTRFLAAASHDLRQPMQALGLLVEGLQERVTDPALTKIVANIRSSVGALTSLLNELLHISRFDAGTVKPAMRSFPISRVLERLRGPSSYAATQRYLSFRVRPCEAVVEADEVLLYRILANLLSNALRYTERGGVLVGCRRRAAGLSIEVWDTGIGIAADQLPHIFREFHQVGNPQRDREQGLGLGLAIVERAARVQGLSVQVRSRPGRGSVFSIAVPYGDPARVAAPAGVPVEPLDGCRVLVVEDDREIRHSMVLLLQGWKCRVEAASAEEEIDAALGRLGSPPDVVVSDYRLPSGRTGLDAIARVRARHPQVAAAITTGDVTPEALRELQAADLPVLHKPVRPARLRALLGAALHARRDARAGEAVESAG